jgi:hypothetical protein
LAHFYSLLVGLWPFPHVQMPDTLPTAPSIPLFHTFNTL